MLLRRSVISNVSSDDLDTLNMYLSSDDTQQYVWLQSGACKYNLRFSAVGAAFGTSKSGIGIAGLGTFKPELIMKVRFAGSPLLDSLLISL